ncbi:MAG: MATE family efflux transporter, partial [Spirochaetaceae bacterium]|nr:MATE family efflux transporter [Spirochaetaceae bacterium]
MAITISEKDEKRRTFILEGDMWKVLISIAVPLVLYNSISQLFSLFDILIASNMSAAVASTVSFISQIQSMLSAIGGGLAVGGGILIARHFGAGDMERMNKNINTLVFLALIISLFILMLVIPFSTQFLQFLRMPRDLQETGSVYFILETAMLICIFINTIYFSIEKAKGNTKIILFCNILMFTLKLGATLFLVYVIGGGILLLSAASLVSHLGITCIAIKNMTGRKNPFRLSFRYIDFSAETLKPILILSLPVFMEKFVFSLGKVIVNSMSAAYGSMVVGALGISNRISAISTTPPIGVEEAEASIISQNLGNNNIARALAIFKRTFIINMGLGLFFFVMMTVFKEQIITLFAKSDLLFAAEIEKIYNYERYATILLAASSSVMGLLYGFGYTRISM